MPRFPPNLTIWCWPCWRKRKSSVRQWPRFWINWSGSPGVVMRKHHQDPVPPLTSQDATIPAELNDLVLAMLAKAKEQRPTMATILDKLERLARRGDAQASSRSGAAAHFAGCHDSRRT